MIKYSEVNGYIHLYVNDAEKEYPICIDELGRIENWNIFKLQPYNKTFKNVSKWVLQLGTTKSVDKGFLIELAELIKEKSPINKIDWVTTFLAIDIYNEYKELTKHLHGTEGRVLKDMEERVDEKRKVIDTLIAKYQL